MFATQSTFFPLWEFSDDKAEFDTRWLIIALTQAVQLRQCLLGRNSLLGRSWHGKRERHGDADYHNPAHRVTSSPLHRTAG
jgi:hypothetical protein